MKNLLAIVFVMTLINSGVLAQDRIILTDGSEIKSKVIEIETLTIKYKKYENQDGPTYNIGKDQVILVLYENGTKDMFSSPQIPENVKQSPSNSVSAFETVENTVVEDPKIKTGGIGYIPVYNYGGYGGLEGGFNIGLAMEEYSAKKGKVGIGYNWLVNGAFYDNGYSSSEIFTIALGIGPGIYALNSDDFRIWFGAYGGLYYGFGSVSYSGYGGYGSEEIEISNFDFYYNISAIATYMFSETIGIYGKIGYSNIDILSLGIAWSPRR